MPEEERNHKQKEEGVMSAEKREQEQKSEFENTAETEKQQQRPTSPEEEKKAGEDVKPEEKEQEPEFENTPATGNKQQRPMSPEELADYYHTLVESAKKEIEESPFENRPEARLIEVEVEIERRTEIESEIEDKSESEEELESDEKPVEDESQSGDKPTAEDELIEDKPASDEKPAVEDEPVEEVSHHIATGRVKTAIERFETEVSGTQNELEGESNSAEEKCPRRPDTPFRRGCLKNGGHSTNPKHTNENEAEVPNPTIIITSPGGTARETLRNEVPNSATGQMDSIQLNLGILPAITPIPTRKVSFAQNDTIHEPDYFHAEESVLQEIAAGNAWGYASPLPQTNPVNPSNTRQ